MNMKHKRYQLTLWSVFTLIIISLLLLTWPPLSTRADPTLPSRDTPTPSSDGGHDDDSDDRRPPGAYIELQIKGAPTGVWTVVQWQDSASDWHNVEGWQGTPDESDKKIWQVAAADFGKGPFRWAVYQGKGGQLWATSESFYLPQAANETMRVEVSLAQ
jgi:hypothetical protein